MVKFFKYGRCWYITRIEAEQSRKINERIYYDKGMKAYYIKKNKKDFWSK